MQYKPYRAVPVKLCGNYAFDRCEQRCKGMNDLGITGYLQEYEKVLDYLLEDKRYEITFLKNMMKKLSKDKVRVVLRHDIDHDIITAANMSDLEKEKGISASYFIAHASPYYYGELFNGLFIRFDDFATYYKKLQNNGSEVGLHVDSFFIYEQGVDGAQAINIELGWLRSLGLKINGFTAHGSAPYYGTENFEIFKEYLLSGRQAITTKGKEIKLGSISAKGCGLDYEGNYSVRPKETDTEKIVDYLKIDSKRSTKQFLNAYLHDNPCNTWGQDITVWLHGDDCWTVASTKREGIFKFSITFKEVVETLKNIKLNQRIVFHIHPIYYGKTTIN